MHDTLINGYRWSEYKSLDPNFEKRAVKIYCEDEFGSYKPIFSYINKLRLRGIESSNYAMRFVSLIPFQRNSENNLENWKTFHNFLCDGKGDSAAHSVFLCSLLLGFNMEAYVVCGISSDGGHYWV